MKTLILLLNLNLAWACQLSQDLYFTLEDAAHLNGLEPALLEALIWQESRYCTEVVSGRGAIGLGQLLPTTAESLGVNPYDPSENLYGAAAYLREQWDRFGDWDLALAAYNAGPAAVLKVGGIPVNGETEFYVPSVLTKYAELKTEDVVSVLITPTVSVTLVSTAQLLPQTGGLSVFQRY